MLLDEIKSKLQELDEHVFFGMVDNSMREMIWDYIVFERTRFSHNANKTSRSYYFTVRIIREDFIPEGFENAVIDKMLEISGMRLADVDPTFDYVPKPNTNVVVEMLSIDFVRPVKV